jgi:hypothetical protein
MITFEELSSVDFEILEFIYNSPGRQASEDVILELFKNYESIHLRLSQLSNPDHYRYETGISIPINNSNYLTYIYEPGSIPDELGIIHPINTHIIKITNLGARAVEDYQYQRKLKLRDKWEERGWRALSLISLIVAILSFLQSLHIIDLSV